MSILVCGSYAYDNIMVFHDRFKNHILPDKVHILNVSFLVPELRREFGGCAGNIAYNLRLLEEPVLPMATVGTDFGPYADWLASCAIPDTHIRIIDGAYTAQAFITTDLDDNQITAFHPGAMAMAHENRVSDAEGVEIGIVSPDGYEGMVEHAEQFAEAGIPFVFDPGQGMPMFDGDTLKRIVEQADWVVVNDYEASLLQDRTDLTPHDLAERLRAYIVTRGGEGSVIYTRDRRIDIPAVPAEHLADPTGCGDAYRAGLLYGLRRGLDWETTGRIAALLGAIKIAHHGTQNHRFTVDGFFDRFHEVFGYRP